MTPTRPLSAFATPAVVEDEFNPHIQVEKFVWPAAVTALVERGGLGLANFALQLTLQAIAGEKVLAFAGSRRGEGRTSVALAIARHVAACGGRAVVVDADIEKPDLARCLGVQTEFGWDFVLRGEMALDEVLITSQADRMAIVPWRQRIQADVLPFHPLRASLSLAMLRNYYDLVLVDGGPLYESGRPNGLASLVQAAHFDGCYLIADSRAPGSTTTAQRVARGLGLRTFGVVENFSLLAQETTGSRRAAA